MAIRDVGDSIYDSAVFIKGNSVGVVKPPSDPVPEPLTILGSLAAGSFGVALRRKYKQQQKDTAKV
ncbi:MAG: PEP-CTERM sorting domain-containing protein [Iphinoe sp. HA4291-MV1]|nr:PEP-CTERM sorting domain-containing protein [Iphinoe sp. HA4291-MV1]